MNDRAETFLRQMRVALAVAHDAEVAGEIEFADACGAVAGNKLAAGIRCDQRDAVVVPLFGRAS